MKTKLKTLIVILFAVLTGIVPVIVDCNVTTCPLTLYTIQENFVERQELVWLIYLEYASLIQSLMSLDVQSTTVNTSTVVPHDEDNRSPLTPGQIAVVTIGTSFAFFISIMFIICFGEFVQYNKRKKAAAARKKLSVTGAGYDSEVRSGSQFESSQSDYTSSFQARQSMSIEPVPSTSRVKDNSQMTDCNIPTIPRHGISNDGVVTLPFDDRFNDVNIDCDNSCDIGNNDIVMLPLIGKQCDDILDIDGEIFCDSAESREMYRLEADV